jgi:hypothetical protein
MANDPATINKEREPDLKWPRVPEWSHKTSPKDHERGSGDEERTKERKITFVRKQCPEHDAYTHNRYK